MWQEDTGNQASLYLRCHNHLFIPEISCLIHYTASVFRNTRSRYHLRLQCLNYAVPSHSQSTIHPIFQLVQAFGGEELGTVSHCMQARKKN